MKQRDLIKRLEDGGFIFERHGGNHDIYRRGSDIEKVPNLLDDIIFVSRNS